MTAPRPTETLLDAFLADGLTQLPDRTYDAVRRDIHGVRQRGRVDVSRLRRARAGAWLGVAAAAALVMAVIALDLRPGGGPGAVPSRSPSETAAPSTQASPAPTPGQPTVFGSPLYGYTVTVPAGWVTAAAVIRWDGAVEPGPFAETDKFAGPASVMAWAYAGPYKGNLAALAANRVAATHRDHADTCPVIDPDVREPLEIGGQPWLLLGWDCGALINEAVTLRRGAAYVFVFRDLAVRAAADPADRALFDSILESVVLPN